MVMGHPQLILQVMVRDTPHLLDFIENEIASVPGVHQVEASTVLEILKFVQGVARL